MTRDKGDCYADKIISDLDTSDEYHVDNDMYECVGCGEIKNESMFPRGRVDICGVCIIKIAKQKLDANRG